tara:strand:+ start:118150 stop:119052 length:903 start_codon:yes stop_codon:yes gene_type:complete
MQRKLVKQGRDALTMTLPRKWWEKHHLRPGDSVEVQESEGKLIVYGEGEVPLTSVSIKIAEDATFTLLKTIIANAYKQGYDIIRIKFTKQRQIKQIQTSVSELIGHEILDINDKEVVIRSVAQDLHREYNNLVRKCFYLVKENMKKVLEDMAKNDFKREDEIKEYRLLVLKYSDYCKRIINKNMNTQDTHSSEYLIIWILEKISKIVHYAYSYMQKVKVSNNDQVTIKQAFDLFINLFENYFRKDISYLPKFAKIKDRYMYDKLFKELHDKNRDPVITYYAASIIARCQDLPGHFYAKSF